MTDLPIPGPARTPPPLPPLSCIATPAEDQAQGEEWNHGKVPPGGPSPPEVHSGQLPPRQHGLPHTDHLYLLSVRMASGGQEKIIIVILR